MKLLYKILLGNVGACVLIGLLYSISTGASKGDGFVVWFGLTCMAFGVLNLFVSIILFLTGPKNREWAQGFLLSFGVLILLGFAVCTNALSSMK